MSHKQQPNSDTLTVELVLGDCPSLLIARSGEGQVRVKIAKVPHLAEILGNVAADLISYQVGNHVPVELDQNGSNWRWFINQPVRMADDRRGKVMGPVGDWSKPFECGCVLVSLPHERPEVHHLTEIKMIEADDR